MALLFPILSSQAQQATLPVVPDSKTISDTMDPNSNYCDSCSVAKSSYHLRKPTKSFYSTMPCSEILNVHPPIELADNMSSLDPVHREWWPVCSLKGLNDERLSDPDFTLTSQVSQLAYSISSNEGCAQPTSELRGAAGYKDPSQKDMGVSVMTPAQVASYLKLAKRVQSRVTETCCNSNSAAQSKCSQLMERLDYVFCKPQHNQNKPDPCTESGTFFAAYIDHKDGLGEMHLSPLGTNGTPEDNEFTLNHEMGHACSAAMRQASEGQSPDFATVNNNTTIDAPGKSTENCNLTPEFQHVYSQLFSQLGINEDSATCLLADAEAGKNQRFHEKPCPGGCPAAVIEESFANTMAILSANHFNSDILEEGLCNGERDNEHPYVMDDLRCHLKSSGITEKLEKGLGCK